MTGVFYNIFQIFTPAVSSELEADFADDLPHACYGFTAVLAVDGSRFAKVGRLLKAIRKITKAIIPGSMQTLYDLRRGYLIDLCFDPNGHASELSMWEKLVCSLPKRSLLLADRFYATPCIWRVLEAAGVFIITRRNKTQKYKTIKKIGRRRNTQKAVWLASKVIGRRQ